MSKQESNTGLIRWDPFQAWEPSRASFDVDLADPCCREPIESALPEAVEADDGEDGRMAAPGFTNWF
jgi:hypothetical protein